MIDVYICEDKQEQRKVIVQYIRSAILIEEYEIELKCPFYPLNTKWKHLILYSKTIRSNYSSRSVSVWSMLYKNTVKLHAEAGKHL